MKRARCHWWRHLGSTLLAGLVAMGGGCGTKIWQTKTSQPRLALGTNLSLRTSLPLVISLRDMELPRRWYLHNTAYFVKVSNQRLRFHVSLAHKWENMADPSQWTTWLEDGFGNRFDPTDIDKGRVKPVTAMYEPDPRKTNYHPLVAFTVYRGRGDVAFFRAEGFPDDGELTLVLRRPGYEFRFTWAHQSTMDDTAAVALSGP